MGVVLDFFREGESNNSGDQSESMLDNSTSGKIISIVNNKGYEWCKSDIIGALISHTTLGEDLTVETLEKIEFYKLYDEIIKLICTIGNENYNEEGYSFKYCEKTRLIYFIQEGDNISDESYVLNVNLIPNKDFSFTLIEILYESNIIFSLGKDNGYASGYNPIEEMEGVFSITDEDFLDQMGEEEKNHLNSMNINKKDLIGAIVSNFYDFTIQEESENIDNLNKYSEYQLLYLLTEIIFNSLGEDFKFVINHSELYLDMKVEDGDNYYLVPLTYKFNYDEQSNNTSIHILDGEKIVCIID